MKKSFRAACAASVFALVAAMPAAALAGVIEGRVSDQSQSVSLEGAIVYIPELGVSAATNRAGEFRFRGVPAGNYTLLVTYVGAEDVEASVSVPNDDATVRQDISLGENVDVVDNILVVGQRGALNSALSQQKSSDKVITVLSSDAIGQLPDENVAEAARRAVGVNVQNDQGEGRYISIRGANPNFVTTTMNGIRIPSPDADQRQVPLDVIDSDILAGITITKSLTPDVDGDSIGGNVEISTLSGLDQKDLLLKLKAAGIYTDQVDKFGQRYSGVIANNFMDGKLGVAASVAYQKRKFGSENVESGGPDWVLDESVIYPEELELRDYQVTRERFSAALNLDYRPNDTMLLYLHGLYSDFSDQEYRSRVENKFDDADFAGGSGSIATVDGGLDDEYEVDRDIKDRFEDQLIYSFVGGGELRGDALTFDWSASYSYAEESEPERLDSGFSAKFDEGIFGVDVSDPVLPTLAFPDADAEAEYFDSDNYEFDAVERTNGVSKDDEYAVTANLRWDTDDLFGAPGYVKFGGKVRLRDKSYDLDLKIYDGYDGEGDLLMTPFVTSVDYALDRVNPVVDPVAFRDFFFMHINDFELNEVDTALESTGANYSAEEDVYAAYTMFQRYFSSSVSVVAGVRMEHTTYNAIGNNVLLQEYEDDFDGDVTGSLDPESVIPAPAVMGDLLAENIEFEYDSDDDETVLEVARVYNQSVAFDKSYTDWLPSMNVRWEVTQDVIARLGYYKTIVRPNLEQAAPRTLVEQGEDDVEGEAGNPLLERQKAHNFDASLEYYPGNKAVYSVGVFYKDISDFIAPQSFDDMNINGVDFDTVLTYVNLPEATLFGIEVNMQQPLDFLPGALDGFIIGANYTYVDGEATLGDGRVITIPGQSSHVATGILGYEKGPIDLRFAATYRGEYLDEINAGGEGIDRIVDDHLQFDVSAKYRVTDQFRVFAEFKNLNDEAFVAYLQAPGFGKLNAQYEEYGWSAKFGVMFNY